MAPLVNQRTLWNAVLLTLFLNVCDDLVTRHLWSHVAKSFTDAVPPDYWISDPEEQLPAESDVSHYDYYTYEAPRRLLEDLVIQVVAYYKLCWLEKLLPTRPLANRDVTQILEKDKEIREREEMEEEIMQKLITEGKVKPVGISWRNVIIRWLLDDIPGNLLIGIVAFTLHHTLRSHSVSEMAEELPMGMLLYITSYWLSLDPLFSIIGHALVPVEYRLQFWSATTLALNLFLSLTLRPVVPWFMKLPAVQNFFEEGAAQNRLNGLWSGQMQRLDAEKEKAEADMREMLASWRDKYDEAEDSEL
jgi:hypothetical protein